MVTGTVTNALRKLYKAIVGEDISKSKNNPTKIICELADNWPEGGGGSSDLSTAQVTIVNNASDDVSGLSFPAVINDASLQGSFSETAGGYFLGGETETLTVLLAEDGCCVPYIGQFSEYTLSGDIALVWADELSFFIITGDCTITITAV